MWHKRCADRANANSVQTEFARVSNRVARISRGKAYFTKPYTLSQYVLHDLLTSKDAHGALRG